MNRSLTILLALILDLMFGDPPNRLHPVVLMGTWLTRGRRAAPDSHRFWFGAGWVTAGILIFTLPWWRLSAGPKQPGIIRVIEPFLLKTVFAYRNLRRNAAAVGQALAANNLAAARQLTGWHLVSRDTSCLNAAEVAGAAIESLAENITDSVTAPLLAYAAGGIPAAWAYRFINTADAMWGYRTREFEQLGKFAARLDDGLNWLPARLTGWLLVAAAGLAGHDTGLAARVMLSQHHRTPSPNAGWTMSAMAGALQVTLTKRDTYILGEGNEQPGVATIRHALHITDICVGLSVILLYFSLALVSMLRSQHE